MNLFIQLEPYTSLDICRVCHCQYSDLETHIHDADSTPHQYWTKEEYNQIVESLDEDQPNIHSEDVEVDAENMFTAEGLEGNEESSDSADSESDNEGDHDDVINKRGIKSSCPLNVLDSFHSITREAVKINHSV